VLFRSQAGDYAVGAAIVKGDAVVAKSGNRIKLDNDPFHHAEIVAIRQAAKTLGARHLHDCVLYTTHEPCPMCASAAVFAKMKGIVYGAHIEDMRYYGLKNGNEEWSWRVIQIPAHEILEKATTPKLFVVKGFMREECKKLFHT
jgi:tRNA(Arg) A34 adenosine deaminase TadA